MSVKSVEELFDDAEQSPQQEVAELAKEATAEAAPEAQPSPAPDAQEAKAEKPEAPAGKDQGAPPAPEDTDGRDPAFGRLRKERNDYREQLSAEKVERARLEERYKALEATNKALEARVSQAPQQAQPQQHDRVPDPNTDPVGFAAYQASLVAQQNAENIRLNMSEENLRDREGDEAVDAAIGTFKQMLGENPALHKQFLAQRNPFKWMYAEVKKREAQAEIGDDPAAYKAKVAADTRASVEAEIRAKLAAEAGQVEPETVPPKANLPPSLGRVPNAGARSVTHTGPVPIDQLWG